MATRADFERCWPWLAPALERMRGTHTKDDIVEALDAAQMQFWQSDKAAMVTEVADYPQMRVVRVVLAGGDLHGVRMLGDLVAGWGETIGAKRLEVIGRRGWLGAYPEAEEVATLIVKELGDGRRRQ
jgi:hypothetical protein